jgi:hypothetical protein
MTGVVYGPSYPIIPTVTEDENSVYFLEKLTPILPNAEEFLNSLAVKPAAFNRSEVINNWLGLQENKDLLEKLTYLNLSSSKMTRIPDAISLCTNLQELNLSKNTKLNIDVLTHLRSLRTLNLMGNQYTNSEISSLERCNLKKIDLRFNQLEDLPPFVNKLENAELKENPFSLKNAKKKWDGPKESVRAECFRLFCFTPLVHSVGTVINVAYRIVKLITLSHFWIPLFQSNNTPYSFKAQLKEAFEDLTRIVAAPFTLIALEAVAIYGYLVNPYRGVIIYAKTEKFAYGQEIVGENWVNALTIGMFILAYKSLIVYCALKYDGKL